MRKRKHFPMKLLHIYVKFMHINFLLENKTKIDHEFQLANLSRFSKTQPAVKLGIQEI